MQLDIRLPLGFLFSIFGLLLLAVGLGSSKELYQRSLGVNINFWWGAVMLLFGLGMLALGRRGHRRLTQTESSTKIAAGQK
jgi:vacuolar-type H+-ATPase subunit I/STV1